MIPDTPPATEAPALPLTLPDEVSRVLHHPEDEAARLRLAAAFKKIGKSTIAAKVAVDPSLAFRAAVAQAVITAHGHQQRAELASKRALHTPLGDDIVDAIFDAAGAHADATLALNEILKATMRGFE